MRRYLSGLLCGFVVCLVVLSSSLAKKKGKELSKAEGMKWLKIVDKVEVQGKDIKAKMELELVNRAGKRRTRRAIFFQKGSDRRLIQFKYPPSEAGISVLIRKQNIHLYLPSFHRVRRIAAHVKNQPFMGSDLTFDDMGAPRYSERYSLLSVHDQGKKIHMVIKPKKGSTYSKLGLWVEKARKVLVRVDYFSKSGGVVKRMVRKKFQKVKRYYLPSRTMVMDLKSKHKTLVRLSKIQMDTGISRRFFSTRYLKRDLEL